jgi:biotin-(acetyl-CoA carboxylase) ligase
VRVELAAEAVVGQATGIDDAGHLVVDTGSGGLRTVTAGDVVHLRPG